VAAESQVGQASYANAAAVLAGRVLNAVQGTGDLGLTGFLDSCTDVMAGLGAVRLVGADIFAPCLLLDRPPDAGDIDIVDESFAVFPTVARPVTPEQRVMAWRDWATGQLLGRLTERAVVAPPDTAEVLYDTGDWQRWSVVAAQLAPLAQPRADGPVVSAVRGGRVALARGVTRAVLRRDFTTAARLARWIALLDGMGVGLPLDSALVIEHLRLHAGADPRLRLDLAIAGGMVGAERT
jgi:hypothetical protein